MTRACELCGKEAVSIWYNFDQLWLCGKTHFRAYLVKNHKRLVKVAEGRIGVKGE